MVLVHIMVHILDGNSECTEYIYNYNYIESSQNSDFFSPPNSLLIPHVCATVSELPSNISTIGYTYSQFNLVRKTMDINETTIFSTKPDLQPKKYSFTKYGFYM